MKTGLSHVSSSVAGNGLLHPVALGSVLVLVLNDHWWKHAWPGVVTGKLSDIAGLVFFPLLLQAIWETLASWIGREWIPSHRALGIAALVTALGFTLVKVCPPVSDAWRIGLAALQWPVRAAWAAVRGRLIPSVGRVSLTRDATDLLTLPSVLVAIACGWKRGRASAETIR